MGSDEEGSKPRKQNAFDRAKLDLDRFKAEAGIVRWLIGTGDHARLNGSFLFILSMVILSGVLVLVLKEKGMEFCKTFTLPAIMGGLGYFAGAGKRPGA